MPIDDGVVIAEKVGGQRPIRALDAHVIEQIAVLAGGEGTVGKGDPGFCAHRFPGYGP
jgi:hypothetical protein